MTFLDPAMMYGPVLKATDTFDFDLTTIYECALAESAQVYGEVKYPDHLSYQKITVGGIDYFQCVKPNIDTPQGYADDWRYCVLPFTMDSYIEGELVAQEKGSIDMWFKGFSLEKTIAAGNTYPFDDMERVSCEVNLDKECPEIEGADFCGQCSYSDISNRYAFIHTNRGECRYCENGTTCNGGDACGEVYCTGGTATNDNPRYYVSCSQCKNNLLYNYNGYNYLVCNDYYNKCVAANCGKIYDNCR